MDLLKELRIEGKEGFDIWYTTNVRKLKKRKRFENLEDVEKWLKVNLKNITINSASLQVFEIKRRLSTK